MSLLAHPLVIRIAVVLLAAGSAFVIGVVLIRRLRQDLAQETAPETLREADSTFPVETYHAVIQKLKEQEQELKALRQADNERARASQNLSTVLLANLATGVLLFNARGIVQQANPAAKTILGYGTLSGLHARDLFRGVRAVRDEIGESETTPDTLLAAVEAALGNRNALACMEADYATPDGESRVLGLKVTAVHAEAGETLGAACLISDLTEISRLSKQIQLRDDLAGLSNCQRGGSAGGLER